MTRAALYARCSTSDRDQNPAFQLDAMRDFAARRGWETEEFVDQASASDLRHRTAWKQLWASATRRRFDVLVVWHLDRASRSTADALAILERLEHFGMDFVSITQPLDTTSPIGKMLFTVSAALAEFETSRLSERVRAGMAHARVKGVRMGRPRTTERPGFAEKWSKVGPLIASGDLSQRRAARRLKVGTATVKRLLDAEKMAAQKG